MLQTTIQQAVFPAGCRVVILSDIHGEYAFLHGLLEKIHFSSEDILVVNGDIIERGPESLRCLRYIMDLAKQQSVYTICGNNDAFVWKLIHDREMQEKVPLYCKSRRSVITEMRMELRLSEDTPARELLRQIRKHFTEELAFIAAMPTILETPLFTFVHAGLRDPNIHSEKNASAFDLMKFDDFLSYSISFEKPVVVGHWPVILYNKGFFLDCSAFMEKQRHIISIDGGCSIKNYAQLNAMILPDGSKDTFTFTSFDLLPVKTALDPQAEQSPTVVFHWPDCRVKILEKGKDISLVRHNSTGKILHVFNADLWQQGNILNCGDSSDGRLPVAAGDMVSVIYETDSGSLIKKDGKIGWYFGRLK